MEKHNSLHPKQIFNIKALLNSQDSSNPEEKAKFEKRKSTSFFGTANSRHSSGFFGP